MEIMREEQEIQALFDELLSACKAITHISKEQEEAVTKAFLLAKQSHAGVRRKSGEAYIFHPLNVALIAVREIGLGPVAVVCALLHDVVEDTDVTLEQISEIFGDRVATIVDGLTKIEDAKILQTTDSKQAENYRKILLSMCEDVYVIFLKLCDRLHNMRTLDSMKDTKRLIISSETQYIYIPLAHRLGFYAIKTELEDLVMKYTYPDKYNELSELIKSKRTTAEKLDECLINPIRELLDGNGIKYTIKSRIKSVSSCWKKMERKGVGFDEIFDLFALRVILDVPEGQDEVEACKHVADLITSRYVNMKSRDRDWIEKGKTNGYRSIHRTVMTPIGQYAEVQIRSKSMDIVAERGQAAHFLYKETHPEEQTELNDVEKWLQKVRTAIEDSQKSALDLVEEFKETLYTKEVYIFTPKGDMRQMPAHSTVLDFAFSIHSDMAIHCIGAKVNGKVQPINYVLHAGEQVQVLSSPKIRPTEEWLQYAHSVRLKSAIKDDIRAQRKPYREDGIRKLDEILQELKLQHTEANLGQIKHFLNCPSETELYFKIAKGYVTPSDIAHAFGRYDQDSHNTYFLGQYGSIFERNSAAIRTSNSPQHIQQGSFLMDEKYEKYEIAIADCCKPVSGENVVGIVTDNKIVIHRTNCKVAMHEMANHENRTVRARWRPGEVVSLMSGIAFTAIDRQGLLQEITKIVTEQMNLNMRAITLEAVDGIVRGVIMLYVLNLENLNSLMTNLRSIQDVQEVQRL